MDLLYDFSSTKVSSNALSNRYQKSQGRNKLWTAVQRDVKKKQNRAEKEAEKTTFVMYVDRDRGAGVTLGAADLTSDLKKKRKDEKIGSLQDNIDWTIYYKEGLADVARGKHEKALNLFEKSIVMVTDPQKLLTPPSHLYLSRAHCYLSLSMPLQALSDANKAIKLDLTCLQAKVAKAEALYNLLMFEKALVMFTKILRVKPGLKAAKMGSVKCSQAIENSITEDCFKVPNLEEVFLSMLDSDDYCENVSPSYEIVVNDRRPVDEKSSEAKPREQPVEVVPSPRKENVQIRKPKHKTKEEAKDFLGPLRHDSNFLHDLNINGEYFKKNNVVKSALEFIENRTHFWQNEDPLKGRKGKSDLMRRQKYNLYSGVRQDCWSNLEFDSYINNCIMMKTQTSSNRRGTHHPI